MQKVLLIDDNEFIRDLVVTKLTEAGYTVATARDVASGQAAIAASKPDLLLLDVELPDGNGLELLELLRSQAVTRTLPVIVFSNDDSDDTQARAKQNNAAFYLKVQVDMDDLILKIKAILG